MPVLAGHDLDGGDAFFLRLVRQHDAADDIADCVDAGDVGLRSLRIDLDVTLRIDLDADFFRAEVIGDRPAADAD